MIQNEDIFKTKVNKNKGCNSVQKQQCTETTVYRNLSVLEDVDAVQGLHLPRGWRRDKQKVGSVGVMCRTADGGSLFRVDTVLG